MRLQSGAFCNNGFAKSFHSVFTLVQKRLMPCLWEIVDARAKRRNSSWPIPRISKRRKFEISRQWILNAYWLVKDLTHLELANSGPWYWHWNNTTAYYINSGVVCLNLAVNSRIYLLNRRRSQSAVGACSRLRQFYRDKKPSKYSVPKW